MVSFQWISSTNLLPNPVDCVNEAHNFLVYLKKKKTVSQNHKALKHPWTPPSKITCPSINHVIQRKKEPEDNPGSESILVSDHKFHFLPV